MWMFYSLLSAFFAGSSDALTKKALESHSSRVISCVKPLWGGLCILPFFIFSAPPTHPRIFYSHVLMGIPFEIIGGLMMNRAIQISPLSQSVPYLAFTPVFLLGEDWIFLHEAPTKLGIFGVIVITIGAFFLQMDSLSSDQFKLKRFIPQSKGAWMMIGVAFIFSITTIFAKISLSVSSPIRFIGTYYFLMAIGFMFFVPKEKKLMSVISSPKFFLPIGIAESLSFFVQSYAMLMVQSAYVIALKRLSLLFSVFYGWFLFKERDVLPRIIGAFLMFIGTCILAFT